MKTPKTLYPQAREIYTCELSVCPECGETLVVCNYQNGRKIVQTLLATLAVGYRPKSCPTRDCSLYDEGFPSARWQHLVPAYCTYGHRH